MCTLLYVCLQDSCFGARDRRMSVGTSDSIWWLQSTVHPTASHFWTHCLMDVTRHELKAKQVLIFVRWFYFLLKWCPCLYRMPGKCLLYYSTILHLTGCSKCLLFLPLSSVQLVQWLTHHTVFGVSVCSKQPAVPAPLSSFRRSPHMNVYRLEIK